MVYRYVVVGGGPTGHHAALELRRIDSSSQITLISEENETPYDRPPLSKSVLSDDPSKEEKLRLLRSGAYADLDIELVTATRITAVDRAAGTAIAQSGKSYRYDRLLIATGSRPRRLVFAGTPSTGEYLRTLNDARYLRNVIQNRGRLVIIGGGFIGLEIAAAARLCGCAVSVLEASRRLARRAMPSLVSDWILHAHRKMGVDVRLGISVTEVKRLPDQSYTIVADGKVLFADAVPIGVGVNPNTDLAVESGLTVDNGIVVNEFCVTSDPMRLARRPATLMGRMESYGGLSRGGPRSITDWLPREIWQMCGPLS